MAVVTKDCTALCRDRHRARRSSNAGAVSAPYAAAISLRCAALILLPDIRVESRPAAAPDPWVDALGLVRSGSHGAGAPRPRACDAHRCGGCVDAVHLQDKTAISDLSHRLQYGFSRNHVAGKRLDVLRARWFGRTPTIGHSAE